MGKACLYLLGGTVTVALALIIIFGWRGYLWGYGAAVAAHNAELLDQIEAGQKLDQARIHALRQRDQLTRELEEQAYADPIVVERCLSPDRVRRLNAIR